MQKDESIEQYLDRLKKAFSERMSQRSSSDQPGKLLISAEPGSGKTRSLKPASNPADVVFSLDELFAREKVQPAYSTLQHPRKKASEKG